MVSRLSQPYNHQSRWSRVFIYLSTSFSLTRPLHHEPISIFKTYPYPYSYPKRIPNNSVMASKPSISRAPSNAGSSVRRNLFHHHLSRRPTSASTSTSATTLPESPQEDSSEIIVKDQSGNYDVQVPLLPPLDGEQAQDDEATEKEST